MVVNCIPLRYFLGFFGEPPPEKAVMTWNFPFLLTWHKFMSIDLGLIDANRTLLICFAIDWPTWEWVMANDEAEFAIVTWSRPHFRLDFFYDLLWKKTWVLAKKKMGEIEASHFVLHRKTKFKLVVVILHIFEHFFFDVEVIDTTDRQTDRSTHF